MKNIENKYKSELEKKQKEIYKLQTKIDFLNKNSSSLEIKKVYINNTSKKKSNINYNQDESTYAKKIIKNEENLIKNQINYNTINKINQNNIINYSHKNMNMNINNNINDNISLYYKYLNNEKKHNSKKSLDNNNSAPNIFLHNSNNSSEANRKKFIANYLKKISNEQNGNLTNHLTKKNDIFSKDNSFNMAKNSNINGSQTNLKKIPFNITNNAFNINKNNINISLNTSILGDNLNFEKYIVQQKLPDYKKLIDSKIEQIMKDKKTKKSPNKNINRSCEVEKRKVYSPKAKLYKKNSKFISSSDIGRNKNNKNEYCANTCFKNISNENIKNKCDKITIISTNQIINKENLNKNKFRKFVKNNNVKGKIYLDSYNEMMNKKNIY